MTGAIQTQYAGCLFRSRLEARWAVFFDRLAVSWRYEPEGFALGGRYGYYLPDFWLPDHRLWLEVKGDFRSMEGEDRWRRFGWAAAGADEGYIPDADSYGQDWYHPVVDPLPREWQGLALLVHGDIPDPRTVHHSHAFAPPDAQLGYDASMLTWYGDCDWQWTACPSCGRVDAQWCGLADRIGCGCSHDGRVHHADAPELLAAYAAARSARFEFGAAERW